MLEIYKNLTIIKHCYLLNSHENLCTYIYIYICMYTFTLELLMRVLVHISIYTQYKHAPFIAILIYLNCIIIEISKIIYNFLNYFLYLLYFFK